ncbi:DUF2330 domain-containing protein [Catenulispora yoronensis]|uniref:DUF2330 domain-containing protein n=1 Tax=Catenulispora yoronensis TaxID=450799 RepID=A0ABN2USS6_9ACTN
MRKWVAKAVTVALAAGTLQGVAVADPAWACGCGAYIPGANGTANVAQEQALLRFDGTTEDVVMRFAVHSDATDAAWVMPVPGPAKATLASQDLFDDLSDAELPRTEIRHHLWPHLDLSGSDDGGGSGAAPGGAAGSVLVLGDQRIGDFEVANLAASDPSALTGWLAEHGFTLKPNTADRLAAYTSQGWQFVAIRLASGSTANLNGTLDPIRITFATTDPVYPMRLSAGATTPQRVEVAMLAPHRMDAAKAPIATLPSTSSFGDWLDPSHTGKALAGLAAGKMFLTVFDNYFGKPAQITQDYQFAQAKSDWIQHPVEYRDELLTIIGIPVYLLILLAVAILILWTMWWLRPRVRSVRGPAEPAR